MLQSFLNFVRIPVAAFVLLPLLSFTTLQAANTYYLAPRGNDSAAGNESAPWQTLAKANQMLKPGDTLVLADGEYTGTIRPANSGTADAWITIRAQTPHGASIVPAGKKPLIALEGKAYIKIENLRFDGKKEVIWGDIKNSHYIAIANNVFVSTTYEMSITACSHVWLRDNVFLSNQYRGDMLHLVDSNELVVEGNSFSRNGHAPLRVQGCFNTVIRSNIFRNNWGRNYEVWASGRVLIERNILTLARDSAGSADTRAKNLYDDSIFRHNRIFGNLHVPTNTGSYIWGGATETGFYRWPFRAMNSRFYHNTITDNLGTGWQLYGMNVSANVFQNNIFYRNDWTGRNEQLYVAPELSQDNRFVHNLFSGTERGQQVIRYDKAKYWTAEEANNETPTVGGFWSRFLGNIDADPEFVDPQNRDYRLKAKSAAIDKGRALAVAVGSGKGTALPVTDGYAFFDGFGIAGETGDLIAVGKGDNTARIKKVELRYYQPALLHLDREVSWGDGDPVSLPWSGEAPDIGAYEHGLLHPDQVVALASTVSLQQGQPVSFRLEALHSEVQSVRWDFGDGSHSTDLAPTHVYKEAGEYGVSVRIRYRSGTSAIDVIFIKVEAADAKQDRLVDADFEDATIDTDWGFMFKFYRPVQTGFQREARSDGKSTAVHLFYDKGKRNESTAQIAPGAWNIDEYPILRFDYRIPKGVPVSIELTTFGQRGIPARFAIGGTTERSKRGRDLNLLELTDDDKWHTAQIDLRTLSKFFPELNTLRQFLIYTDWKEDKGQQFWFDTFQISKPQATSEGIQP